MYSASPTVEPSTGWRAAYKLDTFSNRVFKYVQLHNLANVQQSRGQSRRTFGLESARVEKLLEAARTIRVGAACWWHECDISSCRAMPFLEYLFSRACGSRVRNALSVSFFLPP